MPSTYLPGRLLVDETSRFGAGVLGSGETPTPPPAAAWQKAVTGWLDVIKATQVGKLLLERLGARPVAQVAIVPCLKAAPGPDDPITVPQGSGAQRRIFVVYTPPDAIGGAVSLAADEHPVPVLAHELMHALMDAHDINTLRDASGKPRSIVGWRAQGAYPSATEFLADVVQNMVLSERGYVLRDGHGHGDDDPTITSTAAALQPVALSAFGRKADPGSGVDLARFVTAYRAPLDYLRGGPLAGFAASLAALTQVAFNPFAELVRHAGAGNVKGAARASAPAE